jgi:hypothetical protein
MHHNSGDVWYLNIENLDFGFVINLGGGDVKLSLQDKN